MPRCPYGTEGAGSGMAVYSFRRAGRPCSLDKLYGLAVLRDAGPGVPMWRAGWASLWVLGVRARNRNRY